LAIFSAILTLLSLMAYCLNNAFRAAGHKFPFSARDIAYASRVRRMRFVSVGTAYRCLFLQRKHPVIDYNLCYIFACIRKKNVEILHCSMMLRVADGMVIGIPPGNLFSATFGAAFKPPRSFSGAIPTIRRARAMERDARVRM
jgi:hypothetical protein